MYWMIWRRNVGKPCWMITWTFLGLFYIHNRWRRVIRRIEAEKARSLGPRIRIVLALVGVRLESSTDPSSRRGTSTQVILLLKRTQMPTVGSLSPRRAMIEMPSVTKSGVVSVAV